MKINCPRCDGVGRTRAEVKPGVKIKCNHCGEVFVYEPPVFEAAERPIELTSAATPVGMSELQEESLGRSSRFFLIALIVAILIAMSLR